MIDQLKKLAELQGKATPEWYGMSCDDGCHIYGNDAYCVGVITDVNKYEENKANAEFVLNARNLDLPALVAYVEGLETALSFYANDVNYQRVYDHIYSKASPISDDDGELARQALKQEG